MRASLIVAALLSAACSTYAQAVDEGIAPESPPPEGCVKTVDGNFTIGIALLTGPKIRRETAQDAAGSAVGCTLKDGVLKDPFGRVGSIVANYQFQFDGPPQAGAIYTGGFSVCKNNSLALGGSAVWWRCMSGEFGNLYDRRIGDQCKDVRIVAQLANKPTPTPTPSSESSVVPSTQSPSNSLSSSWSVESATASASILPTGSPNATVSTRVPSTSGLPSGSSSGSPTSPPAPGAAGGAIYMRVPKRETFAAVVGILGAALLL